MTLQSIRFTFRTTDQELDHDSFVHCYVRGSDGATLVGESHLDYDHGKDWEDGRTNTLQLRMVPAVAGHIRSSAGLTGRVDMRAHGNNKWRFDLDVYFIYSDGRQENAAAHGKELNSRGSNTVGFDLSF